MIRIPLSVPHISGKAKEYVNDCLDSGWVSSVGGYVDKFEDYCARYLGKKYAVACVNGTAALHVSLMVSGVEADDEVIIPSLTFAAPAFAVRYTGAYPVFMDVDRNFWQIDVDKVSDFLRNECVYKDGACINLRTRRRIKAIIAVDILGHPVDIDALLNLAHEYGLVVIEDNAESLGSDYKQYKTGARAQITCLSFNGNKVVTAGGGGMLLTDVKEYAQKAKYLTTQAKDHPLEYIHHDVGYNYRLTNLQAALGFSQMEQIDSYISTKRAIARRYEQGLGGIPGIKLMKQAPWAKSSYWLYTILLDKNMCNRRQCLELLEKEGIQTRPLWHPLYSLKPFQDCYAYNVSVVDQLYESALSIPSSVNLSASDQEFVIGAVRRLCK
jgi:perosamine synthetase